MYPLNAEIVSEARELLAQLRERRKEPPSLIAVLERIVREWDGD